MAQVTDRTVGANPTGFDMRTELNNIIAALESDNSGSSEPLNPVPYMKWLDTSNATYYYYKERNHDNTAWVTLFRYTVATKIMEVVSNGVVLQDSTLVHKTGDETIAGVKTFSSSPIVSGIKVGNTAIADATTLDWYEEGTFTQTVIGTTTAGVGTYTAQYGKYTRIGDTCHFELNVSITAHTGTGALWLGGLPFAKSSTSYDELVGIEAGNLTYTGQLVAHIRGDNSYIQPTTQASGVPNNLVAMDTAFSCTCGGTYKV
jgi:hypothetical protein